MALSPHINTPLTNHPLLRRTGSRAAILDLALHPGDSMFGLEENDSATGGFEPLGMKLGDSPKAATLAAAPAVPSRKLCRLQGFLLTVWLLLCGKIVMTCLWSSTRETLRNFSHEAFLFYSPVFMVALMVWLWGINVWGFLHSRVNYPKVFDLDQNHLKHREIWKIAGGLTAITLTSLTFYLYFFSIDNLQKFAVMQPILLYSVLLLIVALPLDVLYVSSRIFCLSTMWRLILPLQPITFADFFLADVLTSMAKVISTLERSICRMSIYPVALKIDKTVASGLDAACGANSLWVPGILSVPYFCRLFQCLRQYTDTREKNCLLNALKYATAFPVIFLSASKYHFPTDVWEGTYKPLWIVFAAINSIYSCYWDMMRDWDLECFSGKLKSKHFPLRTNLLYSRRWVYYWAIGSNLLLRISWTYKHSAHLDHMYRTVLFSGLEMFRRFQWIFFRVEAENIRTMAKSVDFPLEEEKLLGADHDV